MKTTSRPFNPTNLKKKPPESFNVAISMSTYNCEHWIKQTLNSLTQQTWKSWVLFIHDDCSTDSTVRIIRKSITNEARIRLHVNEGNQGPYANHNKSRALAIKQKDFDFLRSLTMMISLIQSGFSATFILCNPLLHPESDPSTNESTNRTSKFFIHAQPSTKPFGQWKLFKGWEDTIYM